MIVWIIVIILAVLILSIIGVYNSLITRRNEAKNSWAQIDVQLKRRNDLIPNLVETVKGYAKHEKEVLENVTQARNMMVDARSHNNPKEISEASNSLSGALKSLFAVSENYPDLKANQNFLMLQEELAGTENKISYARQHYNDMVMMLNNKIEMFPSNMIAGMFNFAKMDLFETSEKERENVKVSF
ncbi:MAG: LemA family protein [Candidatus Nanoarchaeia archaeon]|nr:LemA family protein [Candidatus Nanoarchaeia archaeon]